MDEQAWIAGDVFHESAQPFYSGELDWAINKSATGMAHVVYEPSHPNPEHTGVKTGHGRNLATWVFCERDSDGEGLFSTPLRLVIDSRLDPGAAIGLHEHTDNEELYYVLEGDLHMTTVAPDGRELTAELRPGDAHAIRLGQAHYGIAGPSGARFIVIAVKVTDE